MDQEIKVVMLGDGRVGKTSLVLRYVKNQFNSAELSTINASCQEKWVDSLKLVIWDTAGQERFRALASIYYRKAQGALLVYDITDTSSFVRIQHWVLELRSQADPEIFLVLVGNKSDQEDQRQVSPAQAGAYAKSIGALHCETSAKTGKGVATCFEDLVAQLRSQQEPPRPQLCTTQVRQLRKPDEPQRRCCS